MLDQGHPPVPGTRVDGREAAPCQNYEDTIASWERQAAWVDWAVQVCFERAADQGQAELLEWWLAAASSFGHAAAAVPAAAAVTPSQLPMQHGIH